MSKILKNTLPFLIIFGLMAPIQEAFTQGKENLQLYDFWQYHGDMSNILYSTLNKEAFRQLADRRDRISNLNTSEDWIGYQRSVKEKLREIIGEFPEKTPLNPVVTGVISRQGVQVEKLYFESLPNYYVTAALFIPENKPGPLPAILYCIGHAPEGFRTETYQQVILNYVKKGFAVMTFDPIGQGERQQYSDSLPAFNPTREHSYPGTQMFLAGRSPAYNFIWDGIRAIDYMVTRPEIDSERIGLTGRSGGGTQTTFIAAFDDRIKAFAPEAYVNSFEKLLLSMGPPDAEQNLMGALFEGIDIPDILAASAPRPLMIVSTTRDFISIQGARDAYSHLKHLYRAYGKEKLLYMTEDDGVHASTKGNRESAYLFFRKYLSNPGHSSDEKVTYFTKDELRVTPDGNIFRHTGGHDLFSLNQLYLEEEIAKKLEKSNNDLRRNSNLREEIINHTGYRANVSLESPIFSGRYIRNHYNVEKYLVKGSGDYFIPLIWLRPEKPLGKIVLFLDDKGKSYASGQNGMAACFAKQGYDVVIPDLIGIGELGGGYNRGSAFIQDVPLNVWYLGVLTKMSPTALRMGDIQILSNLIRSQSKPFIKFSVVGRGSVCTDLLYAALLDLGFDEVNLINPLISYQSLIDNKYYKAQYMFSAVPGAASRHDIPDIIETLAPLTIRIINPVDGRGLPTNSSLTESTYKKAIEKYRLEAKEHHLTILNEDLSIEAPCTLLLH